MLLRRYRDSLIHPRLEDLAWGLRRSLFCTLVFHFSFEFDILFKEKLEQVLFVILTDFFLFEVADLIDNVHQLLLDCFPLDDLVFDDQVKERLQLLAELVVVLLQLWFVGLVLIQQTLFFLDNLYFLQNFLCVIRYLVINNLELGYL